MHLAANNQVDLGSTEDNLALDRIRPALRDPQREILRIGNILRREFTRLYRKRNMIVHGGQIHESNLAPISETMTPLSGAGIDRFVHVGLSDRAAAGRPGRDPFRDTWSAFAMPGEGRLTGRADPLCR